MKLVCKVVVLSRFVPAELRFYRLYIIAKKIIDVRPSILKAINCKNYRKSPGLFKIAERLNVKIKGEQHNALNDAVLLYGVCRELNIQMSI